MQKKGYYQYYVEGEDERKLLSVLKTEMECIVPGKIEVFNVVQEEITAIRLMQLKKGTTVILVFDTDEGNIEILRKNMNRLSRCQEVSSLICIPQVNNLEDELLRSCHIKQIKELLGSKSNKDFKHDLIVEKNLKKKLLNHGFDIQKFWNRNPENKFREIILGHLAAYDVEPLVIGAADDTALEDIVLGQVEVVDFHGDNSTLVGSKIIVVSQESKAVGAYVVQLALNDGSTVRKRNGAGIGNIQTRVFALGRDSMLIVKWLESSFAVCTIFAVSQQYSTLPTVTCSLHSVTSEMSGVSVRETDKVLFSRASTSP